MLILFPIFINTYNIFFCSWILHICEIFLLLIKLISIFRKQEEKNIERQFSIFIHLNIWLRKKTKPLNRNLQQELKGESFV